MAGGGEKADGDVGFQIAPMIDLILVLMVFFMSTVAMKQVENELSIQLPGIGKAGDSANNVPLNIEIDIDGSISVNAEPLAASNDRELKGLKGKLAEQIQIGGSQVPVFIVPQPDVPHSRVIDVLNACSSAGVKNLSFGG
jgi:biopolymer transport protein ExbD